MAPRPTDRPTGDDPLEDMTNLLAFPLGWIGWRFNAAGQLVEVRLWDEPPLAWPEDSSPPSRDLRERLSSYLKGHPVAFDCPLAPSGTTFQRQVWETLRQQVAWGRVLTYGELAGLSGYPRAARAVGTAMKLNPWPLVVPCHRVIAQGGPGGYFGRLDWKRFFLRLEGVCLPGG